MGIEGDAVVGEVRVERIAESLLGREPHERTLRVEQFLLGRRQAGLGGERKGRKQDERCEDGFHGRMTGMALARRAGYRPPGPRFNT